MDSYSDIMIIIDVFHCILAAQLRNLSADLEQAREQLDEEQEGKADLQRQVTKLSSEVQQWRSRYESEGKFKREI